MTAGCPNRQRRHAPSSWTTPNPDTTLLGLYFQQRARAEPFIVPAPTIRCLVYLRQRFDDQSDHRVPFGFGNALRPFSAKRLGPCQHGTYDEHASALWHTRSGIGSAFIGRTVSATGKGSFSTCALSWWRAGPDRTAWQTHRLHGRSRDNLAGTRQKRQSAHSRGYHCYAIR